MGLKNAVPDKLPQELNRLDVLRGLRLSIREAGLSTIWAALTTGAFLTGFALMLGADSVALGFLTAIPTFAGLIQIFASYAGERLPSRKPITVWFTGAGRLLWLPILLLPFVLPHGMALAAFLLLYAFSYVLLNVPTPAFLSWLSDLVPPDGRGRFFAQRNQTAGFVTMALTLPAAWFLDRATKQYHNPQFGFGVLFALGVAGGIAGVICLLRQPEPPKAALPERTGGGLRGIATDILAFYRTPFQDRNFVRLLIFNVVFGMGQNLAAPFFNVFALQNLHLDYVALQLLATVASVAALVSMPLWGYLTDKFGNKPMLMISVVGVFSSPLSWALASPLHRAAMWGLLVELNVMSGMFWALAGLAQFNLLIRLSPSDKTSVYVATMAGVTGLSGGTAPLLGSFLMRLLSDWHGTFLGLAMSSYQVTFAVSAALRFGALFLLRPVRDAESASARQVLQQISHSGPRTWRSIRQIRRGRGEQAKLQATHLLAESRSQLAVGELLLALRDPSLAVREESTRALGEIGDPASVDALLETLRDPSLGLIDEASRALEQIGDLRAVPALIALLQNHTFPLAPREQQAILLALGALGGPDATVALLAELERGNGRKMKGEGRGIEEQAGNRKQEMGENAPKDEAPIPLYSPSIPSPFPSETIVRALGRTGNPEASRALTPLLRRDPPLRYTVVRALANIACPDAVPALLDALAVAPDDDTLISLLADALAAVDATEAVLPLLDRLPRLRSEVARKQTASAIGALLGNGDSVYQLLAQDPLTRDATVARMVSETSRGLRALSGTQAAPALAPILEAYIGGDYIRCLRTLDSLATSLPMPETTNDESANRSALSHACLHHLAARADETTPPESALLAVAIFGKLVSGGSG